MVSWCWRGLITNKIWDQIIDNLIELDKLSPVITITSGLLNNTLTTEKLVTD